jgi:hypothetical protein
MTTTTLRAILPALLACACAFGASAQDATVAAEVDAQAKAETETTQSIDHAANKDRIAERHCVRATGSRVLAMQNAKAGKADRHCAIGPGRVHTSDDIQHTGAASLGDALRRLEPSGP